MHVLTAVAAGEGGKALFALPAAAGGGRDTVCVACCSGWGKLVSEAAHRRLSGKQRKGMAEI